MPAGRRAKRRTRPAGAAASCQARTVPARRSCAGRRAGPNAYPWRLLPRQRLFEQHSYAFRGAAGPGRHDLSVPTSMIEDVFEQEWVSGLVAVDPHADEAALVERIALLERVKAAAAAGQARAAAALDASRRSAEAEAGVPTRQRGRGGPARPHWPRRGRVAVSAPPLRPLRSGA